MNWGSFPAHLSMKFQRNVLLKNYTTFKIGGRAKYFFIAKTKNKLIKAVQEAKKLNLPFFILGAGSNVLFSDQDYRGLVIQFQNQKLSQLVSKGLEWAAGIPGTVAGAIRGNAGAFGQSMKDVVKQIEVFDVKEEKIKILKNKDCRFGYRDSIFKKNPNLIILSAEIKFKKSNPQKIKKYLEYRKKTQPLNFPSAGSIFKNPPGFSAGELGEEDKFSSSAFAAARLIGEEDKSSSSAFAAARLIEECGLKGKKIGGAQISKIHSNFIINSNQASSQDVLKLINLVKKKVKNKFGIKLEEEIQILK